MPGDMCLILKLLLLHLGVHLLLDRRLCAIFGTGVVPVDFHSDGLIVGVAAGAVGGVAFRAIDGAGGVGLCDSE